MGEQLLSGLGTGAVIASLAPSFVAGFEGSGISAMRDALKKLGFDIVGETAAGAREVSRRYAELSGKVQEFDYPGM